MPTFNASMAPPTARTPFTRFSFSLAKSAMPVMIGLMAFKAVFTAGNKTEPIVMPISDSLLVMSWKLLAVVAALASNSLFIDPAYWLASPTFARLPRNASRLVSSGAIAPIDSLPNNSFMVAACMCFGSFCKRVNRSSIAPPASTCIRLASFSASKPSDL